MPDVAILLLMTQLLPAKDCQVKINEVVFVPAVLTDIISFVGLEFSLEFDFGLGSLLGLVSWLILLGTLSQYYCARA